MTRYFLLIFALIPILTCRTVDGGRTTEEIEELSTLRLESIQSKLDGELLAEAYQEASYLERNPGSNITAAEIEDLKKVILDRFSSAFHSSIDEEDYRGAIRYYCSLLAIGKQDLLPEWSLSDLFFLLAKASYEEEDKPLALLYAQRALAVGEPAEQPLLSMLELAREIGNVDVYKRVLKIFEEKGFNLPEADPGLMEVPTVEKMVQGTVTIWVNKGIKLERGIGFPDRVIGSGFFIDKRGYLLTNYHVIASEVDPEYEGYSRLFIRLSDKVEEKVPAKVVGYDRIFDLALIKAEVEPNFIYSYSGSSELKIGGRIIAIGSPAGLENTVTSGIVSATGRRFLQMGDAIQVDVPINYGNSGGPLLDEEGRLIGVVFAGIEQFEGVNFAIPYDWVQKALPRLYGGEEASHPWLGLALNESDKGLEVIYTVPDSPAEQAGIVEGDIIRTLNGRLYEEIGDIQAALLDLDYPCLVGLEWQREGQSLSGAVSLAARPFSPIEDSLNKDLRDNVLFPLFGMKIEKTGQFLWKKNYTISRVLSGSIADETGLSEDDPLTVQGFKIDTENRFAVLQIQVKKRKLGFLESIVQLAAYLETDIFI